MHVDVACANCGRPFRVPESSLGRQARCSKCGQQFVLKVTSQETVGQLAVPSTETSHSAIQVPFASAKPDDKTPPPVAPKNFAFATGDGEPLPTIKPYVCRRMIGEGAMGKVYLAHDPRLDREVAIKVLPRHIFFDPQRVERFRRESRMAAKVQHPNTVIVYEADVRDGHAFLVMELVAGQSLDKIVPRGQPLNWREATQTIRDAAAGLGAAHEFGVVHRDVKPANLIRTHKGVTKVLDFGLARALQGSTQLTQEGSHLGTPAYMAPECWTGQEVDARSDLYALICSYYQLLTGRVPFDAGTWHAVGYQHRYEPVPDPRTVVPDLPDAVCRILIRGSQKEPGERYQNAGELLAEFDALLAAPPESLTFGLNWLQLGGRSSSGPKTGDDMADDFYASILGSTNTLVARGRTSSPIVAGPANSLQGSIFRRRGYIGVALAGLALSGVLAALFSGLFGVRTPEGTIALRVNEPNADVLVDGQTITVQWGSDGKSAEITAPAGKHRIDVKKSGFTVAGKELTVTEGNREIMTVALESDTSPRLSAIADSQSAPGKTSQSSATTAAKTAHPNDVSPETSGPPRSINSAKPISSENQQVAASAKEVYLDDLPEFDFVRGQGILGKHGGGCMNDGRKCKLNGTVPVHSLFPHPPRDGFSSVSYHLDGRYSLFRATAAISEQPDKGDSSSPLTFRVLGDGKKLWESRALRKQNESQELSVPVEGVKILTLQVQCPGTNFFSWSIWVDPRVINQRFPYQRWHFGQEGRWSIDGDELFQELNLPNGISDEVLIFGDSNWTDYDFSVEMKLVEGNNFGSLLARCEAESDREGFGFSIGTVGGGLDMVASSRIDSKGKQQVKHFGDRKGTLTKGRWYHAEIRLRGDNGECFLDGVKVFEFPADEHKKGKVGLGTWSTSYRFRNIVVKDPTGKVLLEGLPALDRAREDQFNSKTDPSPSASKRSDHSDEPPAAKRKQVDLLKLVDLKRDIVSGYWTESDGALTSNATKFARLAFRYAPPDEYDFAIEFTRNSGDENIAQIGAGGGRQFAWEMSGAGGKKSGFSLVGGKLFFENATFTEFKLETGRRYKSVLKVRRDRVEAWVDGALIDQWKTDFSDMSAYDQWSLPDSRVLGIGSWESPTTFHSATVSEVSSSRKVLAMP